MLVMNSLILVRDIPAEQNQVPRYSYLPLSVVIVTTLTPLLCVPARPGCHPVLYLRLAMGK